MTSSPAEYRISVADRDGTVLDSVALPGDMLEALHAALLEATLMCPTSDQTDAVLLDLASVVDTARDHFDGDPLGSPPREGAYGALP